MGRTVRYAGAIRCPRSSRYCDGNVGKALGGASGGYTAAHEEIVEMLRQRSRPYLFSNSLAPSIAAAGIAMLDLLETSGELLQRLRDNTAYFRSEMVARNFDIPESDHPIVPIMIGDAVEAAAMADRLLAEGIYVRAFSFPVVPRGKARIRTQMSAAHSRDDLDQAITAFEKVRRCRRLHQIDRSRLGTICLPSGIRETPISLKFAIASGMPMIVTHSRIPVAM